MLRRTVRRRSGLRLQGGWIASPAKLCRGCEIPREIFSGRDLHAIGRCTPSPFFHRSVTSLQRFVVPLSSSRLPAMSLWRGALVMLAIGAFLVVRSCGYEFGVVASYGGYFALYVALPGVISLYFVHRGP